MTTRRTTTSKTAEPPAGGIAGVPDRDDTSITTVPDQVPASTPDPGTVPTTDPDPGRQPAVSPDPTSLPVSDPTPTALPTSQDVGSRLAAADTTTADDVHEGVQARVEVLVAHDQVLRGETGVVDLTARVQALINVGYLRLLGIESSTRTA